MEITQEEYTKKLKNLDKKLKEAILTIESNPAIFTLAETYDLDQDTTYSIANKVNLQLLNFITSEELFSYIEKNTSIDSEEFKYIYPSLLTNIFNKSNQPLFKSQERIRGGLRPTDSSTSISHLDVLNEIENPTPSLRTTTDFQNIQNQNSTSPLAQSQTPVSSSNPLFSSANTSNTPINPTNLTPSTPFTPTASLHSPEPIAPYVNPALQISSKLGQNLSTPSVSTSKDVYVSKKPDPYHEPVDL